MFKFIKTKGHRLLFIVSISCLLFLCLLGVAEDLRRCYFGVAFAPVSMKFSACQVVVHLETIASIPTQTFDFMPGQFYSNEGGGFKYPVIKLYRHGCRMK
jgi:hypothetical protein